MLFPSSVNSMHGQDYVHREPECLIPIRCRSQVWGELKGGQREQLIP